MEASSIVEYFGTNRNSCGYCGSQNGSVSHGMWAHSLSVDVYQELLDHGWRRSGHWIYKPSEATCCPQYTIRLEAQKFAPNRAQRRIMRRMDTFLSGQPAGASPRSSCLSGSSPVGGSPRQRARKWRAPVQPSPAAQLLAGAIDATVHSCVAAGQLPAASYPAASAAAPSIKQRKHLSDDIGLTSPSAMAVASTARKAAPSQQGSFSAVKVAATLAEHVNNRLPAGWHVQAVAGFLNCSMPQDQHQAQLEEQAAESELPAHPPPPLTADAQPNSSRPQVSGAAQEEQPSEGAAGGGKLPPAGLPAQALSVRISKRRSCNDLGGVLPMSSMVSMWQEPLQNGLHGSSPTAMSISGTSPMAWRPLGRTPSLAAVTSRNATAAEPATQPVPAVQPSLAERHSDAEFDMLAAASPTSCMSATALAAAWPGYGSSAVQAAGATMHPKEAADSSAAAATSRESKRSKLQLGPADAADQNFHHQHGAAGPAVYSLQVCMVPSSLELVETEFSLYKRYQVHQHGDREEEVSKKSFIRFLIDSPLPHTTAAQESSAADDSGAGQQDAPQSSGHAAPGPSFGGFGSFHMQYWLESELIAVSVVDVLPHCLSSVYTFWDKQYAHLSLGKYSVMREVEWVSSAMRSQPDLRYLYLGYWIASNPKMRYKAEFDPSDLLCPKSLCWVPHERVVAAIPEGPGYVSLCAVSNALDGLGQQHGIDGDGHPDKTRLQVHEEQVLETRVMLVSGRFGQRVAQLLQIQQAELLQPVEFAVVVNQVRELHQLAGQTAAMQLFCVVQLR